jgi:hypothetical protein
MADYYPVIARAVAALPKNTEATRLALYARARSTLSAHLLGQSATNVTRECNLLEEAIRKVEADQETQKIDVPVGSKEDAKAKTGVTSGRAQSDAPSSATKSNSKNVLHCSFCGKTQDQAQALIAGPKAFICSECTRSYANRVSANVVAPKIGDWECSFCGKRPPDVSLVAAGFSRESAEEEVTICHECVVLCTDIVRDNARTEELKIAVDRGEVAEVIGLLDRGADVDSWLTPADETPLIRAVESGRCEVALALLSRGADPNDSRRGASPPLMIAVDKGDARIVQALLAHGADANAPRGRGLAWPTPLMIAAENGDAEIVQALLAHGADTCATTGAGRNALAFAGGQEDVAELLKIACQDFRHVSDVLFRFLGADEAAHQYHQIKILREMGKRSLAPLLHQAFSDDGDPAIRGVDGDKMELAVWCGCVLHPDEFTHNYQSRYQKSRSPQLNRTLATCVDAGMSRKNYIRKLLLVGDCIDEIAAVPKMSWNHQPLSELVGRIRTRMDATQISDEDIREIVEPKKAENGLREARKVADAAQRGDPASVDVLLGRGAALPDGSWPHTKHHSSCRVIRLAVERIADQDLLKRVAETNVYWHVRLTVVRSLQDIEFLRWVVENDTDSTVAEAAARRLSSLGVTSIPAYLKPTSATERKLLHLRPGHGPPAGSQSRTMTLSEAALELGDEWVNLEYEFDPRVVTFTREYEDKSGVVTTAKRINKNEFVVWTRAFQNDW